jgi:cell division protein FtsN
MLDKIWELFTSDDRIDRLLTRAALLGLMVGVYFIAYYASTGLLIALGVIVTGIVTMVVIVRRADKKAEEEYKELLRGEDDGVTGYIAVRPEELEAAPWEKRDPQKSAEVAKILETMKVEQNKEIAEREEI